MTKGKVFRVFLSSTFSDMIEERNALHRDVFPELVDLCKKYGARFQVVDLRWGINNEAGMDHRTITICLEEVRRCQHVTPNGPNFIILLGDRYGWCPPPSEVPASEFEPAVNYLTLKQRRRLERWYKRDENAIPPTYVLQPYALKNSNLTQKQGKKILTKSQWERMERELHDTLEIAGKALQLDETRASKYTDSATEQEIHSGLIDTPDAAAHVHCFIRKIHGLPRNITDRNYIDLDHKGFFDTNKLSKLEHLKEKLKKILPETNFHLYDAQWTGETITTDHIEAFCNDVYSSIKGQIDAVFKTTQVDDPKSDLSVSLDDAIQRHTQHFVGREVSRKKISEHLSSLNSCSYVIHGLGGIGKTALMSQAIQDVRRDYSECTLIYRLLGTGGNESNVEQLLVGLCSEISTAYQYTDLAIPADYQELLQVFKKCLALATADRPLILFLDALDQLNAQDNTQFLTWLPVQLPNHVKLVASVALTKSSSYLTVLKRRLPTKNLLELNPMTPEEGEELLGKWLKDAQRTLTQEQFKAVPNAFEKMGNPLYLRLLFAQAQRWHSYDDPIVTFDNFDLEKVIEISLFENLKASAYHTPMLVEYVLGYLAASKHGLAEDEIIELLSADDEFFIQFQGPSIHHQLPENRLPFVVWSRLYFDLQVYLSEETHDNVTLLGFYHRQFVQVTKELVPQKHFHRRLANYFNKQETYIENGNRANLRRLSELAYQYAHGEELEKLRTILTDLDYMQAKLEEQGMYLLLEDYELVKLSHFRSLADTNKYLDLIRNALRLSAHIVIREPSELAGQLAGRLLGVQSTEIQAFLERIKNSQKGPWLRPLIQSLTPADSPQLHVLSRADSVIGAVAINKQYGFTADGSDIRVWNLRLGQEIYILRGSTGKLTALAVSVDGKCIISGSASGEAAIWMVEEELQVGTCHVFDVPITAITVSPDDRFFVCTSDHVKLLKVFRLDDGIQIHVLTSQFTIVGQGVFSDSSSFLSGSWEGITEWDIETGCEVAEFPRSQNQQLPPYSYHRGDSVADVYTQIQIELGGKNDRPTEPDAFAILPNAHCIIVASGAIIEIWDLNDHSKVFSTNTDFYRINEMVLTPDAKSILIVGRLKWGPSDDVMEMWDLKNLTLRTRFEGHTEKITHVAISPDSEQAISASEDDTVRIWNLSLQSDLERLPGHTSDVWWVDVSPDSEYAFAALANGGVQAWNLLDERHNFVLDEHLGSISRVVVTRDNRYVVAGLFSGAIQVWDCNTREELWRIELRNQDYNSLAGSFLDEDRLAITALTASSDSRFIVSGSGTGSMCIIDLVSEGFSRIDGHRRRIQGIAITPDNLFAVTGSDDSLIKIWNLEEIADSSREVITEVLRIEVPASGVSAVSITPDGQHILSGSWDGSVRVWDFATGSLIHTFQTHHDVIPTIAVFSDNRRAISASADGTLRVWDLHDGLELFVLDASSIGVGTIRLTSNEKYVLSFSNDGIVKAWDLAKRQIIARYTSQGAVMVGALSADGQTVIAGGVGYLNILRFETGV